MPKMPLFLVKNTLFNFPKFPGNGFRSRDGKWFSGSRDPGTGNSRLGLTMFSTNVLLKDHIECLWCITFS